MLNPSEGSRTLTLPGVEKKNSLTRPVGSKERSNAARGKDRGVNNFMRMKMGKSLEGYVLHPHQKSMLRWNFFIFVILLISAPLLPLQLAFVSDRSTNVIRDYPALFWLNLWADIMLSLDMTLQFFVQVQAADKSHWIPRHDIIARRYVMSGSFFADLFAVIPILHIISVIDVGNLSNSYMLNSEPCTTSLIGFHKLVRFTRIRRVVSSMQAHTWYVMHVQLTYQQQTIIREMITVVLSVHIMACLWSSLAVCGQAEYTWFDYLSDYEFNVGRDIYSTNTNYSTYIFSLYWAVFTFTGIGYGDITPVSPIEYCMAIICMFVAALTWQWVVAHIVSIVSTMNSGESIHLMTLDSINELLSDPGIVLDDPTLGRRLREYFTKMRDVTQHDFVNNLIDRLSPELMIEVVYAIHEPWLTKIWWLRKIPERTVFVVEMTQQMLMNLHAPNELVPNKQELSVIRHGLCIHGGALKSKGMIFGEDMLLENEALRKPYATLALTFLHLLGLSKPTLDKLLVNHPDVAVAVRRSYAIFVMMRGMIYRAAKQKELEHLKEVQAAQGDRRSSISFHAMDSQAMKPMGDCEDVIHLTAFDPTKDEDENAQWDTSVAPAALRKARSAEFDPDVLVDPRNVISLEVASLKSRVTQAEQRMREKVGSLESCVGRLTDQLKILDLL